MEIRKIKANEINLLIELYKHYLSADNIPNLTDQTINEIRDEIFKNPCISYFINDLGNRIVSSCILTITPSFIRGGKGYGTIEHVVVHKDYRRRGIGESMLKFALNYAWKNGCTEVMLLSGSQNIGAHQLYEKIGFDSKRKKGFIIFKP